MNTDTQRIDSCLFLLNTKELLNGLKMFMEKEAVEKLESELAASQAESESRRQSLAFALNETKKVEAEVERLKKELDAWDYGTRAEREQKRAEKAEAEIDRLRELLTRAIDNCECEPKCSSNFASYCDCGRYARNEVIREELARLAPSPEEAPPKIQVIREKMSPEKAEEVRKIRLLIGEDELEKIANTPEPTPEWRLRADGELMETGDQIKCSDEWHMWEGTTYEGRYVGEFWKEGEVRTRRPLPVQEMPLEKELDYLTSEASRAADIHNHVVIVDCIRYLRDEIEALKKNQK
jgi:regulator of replication initiation timing